MILQLGDATVHTASSVAEAHEILKRAAPDAIVSDLTMPGEDGYAFVKRLRADRIDIPAIALTGHVGREDEQKARDAGFNAYLGKPVDPMKLLAVIGEVLAVR